MAMHRILHLIPIHRVLACPHYSFNFSALSSLSFARWTAVPVLTGCLSTLLVAVGRGWLPPTKRTTFEPGRSCELLVGRSMNIHIIDPFLQAFYR